MSCLTPIVAAVSNTAQIQAYDDVRGLDLSALDLRDKADVLFTLTFDTRTIWPPADKMPPDFSPADVLAFGKDPGLGLARLHQLGFTGRGVNIAYVDQPLWPSHQEYVEQNVRYYKVGHETVGMDTSMHGPSVLSILAGKEIGVAPESNVYYFGHASWLADQATHAAALYKLIEVNKDLPDDQKIRVVGFSDTPNSMEKNIDVFQQAIIDAEEAGIMVIDVTSLPIVTLVILCCITH